MLVQSMSSAGVLDTTLQCLLVGDLSVPLWGPNARDPLEVCRPLGVEVYKVHPDILTGWKSPEKASYAGRHGLAAKPWA